MKCCKVNCDQIKKQLSSRIDSQLIPRMFLIIGNKNHNWWKKPIWVKCKSCGKIYYNKQYDCPYWNLMAPTKEELAEFLIRKLQE